MERESRKSVRTAGLDYFSRAFFHTALLNRNVFLNWSIWSIDGALTDTTTLGQRKYWVMAIKGYSTFLRSPELEPYHQMQFKVLLRGGLWFLIFFFFCIEWGNIYSYTDLFYEPQCPEPFLYWIVSVFLLHGLSFQLRLIVLNSCLTNLYTLFLLKHSSPHKPHIFR